MSMIAVTVLFLIAFTWRRHLNGWWLIWTANTPVKKELARMCYQLDARGDKEAAEKHVHNAIMMKAREIWEREESHR